jgi:hypothetical protein
LMGSLAAGGTDVISWQLIDDQRIVVFWWWSKNKTLDDREIKLIRRWSKNVVIKYGRMTSTAAMSETSIFNQMRGDMFRLEAETTAFAWEFHPSAYTLFCNLFAGKSKSNSCRIIFARFLCVYYYMFLHQLKVLMHIQMNYLIFSYFSPFSSLCLAFHL